MAKRAHAARRHGPASAHRVAPAAAARAGASPAAATATAVRRFALLDAFRGAAIVAMVVYHFCFDLALNGWLAADFGDDWRWVAFRVSILGSFLFAAGVSFGLAGRNGFDERRYWRRIATIAGAALLVTVGSATLFPESYIYFGVLHAIAVMSVLGRPLLPLGRWLAPLGLAVIVAGVTVKLPVFDHPLLHWIGMMTFRPRTEDYVPLVPWFGAMLVGMACGAVLAEPAAVATLSSRIAAWSPPNAWRLLPWLGRHSLAIYLLHQPLLLGAMLALKSLP
jgi:uncharacterized membrane protein